MAENNKRVKEITARDEDFAQWYTDVVKKAELADYSSVRGCMVLRPLGCALWEGVQRELDGRFKALGHENVGMPMFIPESLLNKEKDHVEGFAPEVAWITHGGSEKLTERLCVRPTSETLFCEHFKQVVQSYRDLPKLYNQWCSVVRWEKSTRPFLRTTEFWWQEGHTVHETKEEAEAETLQMLDCYIELAQDVLAIPVLPGRKTDKEKFAGAEATYTIEAMMHDGKALQSGTTHYFGDGFCRAFDIQFTGRDNKLQYPHQTSWGMSTRIIGALIMVHGDDSGLVLPPRIAPTQVMIVPIQAQKEGVTEACEALLSRLKPLCRIKMDARDASPGWKFAEHEMRGIPLRIELGPKDLDKGQCVLARRDTGEKLFVPLSELESLVPKLLEEIQQSLFDRAKARMDERIYDAGTLAEAADIAENKPGFVRALWCGELACEEAMKEQAGLTSRCMPFGQEGHSGSCCACGKAADTLVVWGKAY